MVKRLLTRLRGREPEQAALAADAVRGRAIVEESREIVVVLDARDRVVAASRRARHSLPDLVEGQPLSPDVLEGNTGHVPLSVPLEVDGRRERLVYLSEPGDLAAYEELRTGFTASVSHELRTPLARLLTLFESALLPGADVEDLVEQARREVDQIRELIDEVMFLSELETGREVVAFGSVHAVPLLEGVAQELAESAARAGVFIEVGGEPDVELPLRPRMIKAVARNLLENAIRYAGPGARCTLLVARENGAAVLEAADTGVGVPEDALPRLFERFYRADRARASRGTGLGLAIVKHVVTSAGGTVEASGGPGRGLVVRCVFPANR